MRRRIDEITATPMGLNGGSQANVVALYGAVRLIRLTVDQMLAEPFPRFKKSTATIAFKR